MDNKDAVPHIPNHETRKAIEDAEKGIGLSKIFDTVDDMLRDLEI